METRRAAQQAGRRRALGPQTIQLPILDARGPAQTAAARDSMQPSRKAGSAEASAPLLKGASNQSGLPQSPLSSSNGYPSGSLSFPSFGTSSAFAPHNSAFAYASSTYSTGYPDVLGDSSSSYLPFDFASQAVPSSLGMFGLPEEGVTSLNMPWSASIPIQGTANGGGTSVVSPAWPSSSSFGSLTYSSGSPSSVSSDQMSVLSSIDPIQHEMKQFLNQEDLLSISPLQTIFHRSNSVASIGPATSLSTSNDLSPSIHADSWDSFQNRFSPDFDLFSTFSDFATDFEPELPIFPEDLLVAAEESEQASPTASAEQPKFRATQSFSSNSKQLGSFQTDDAFATSLNQLSPSASDGKPPYLWWTLIRAAILGSPGGRLQMETLCTQIMEKFPYFRIAKEAKNWKSSIRSVIHTKPCFYKSEDEDKTIWWHVDVNIDPREQRRGMKKRNSVGEAKGPTNLAAVRRTSIVSSVGTSSTEGDDELDTETDEDEGEVEAPTQEAPARKRRKTG